jgi:hypothetical protein
LMRRMAGTGLQPRARHRRQISPSNTSTPGHQERQRRLDRHRRMSSSPTPSVRTLAAPPSTPVATPSPQSGAASVAGPATPLPEFVTPLENDEEQLDAAHGELPVRYRAYNNIIGAGEHVPGLAARNLIEELNLMSTGEPCTFAEAE